MTLNGNNNFRRIIFLNLPIHKQKSMNRLFFIAIFYLLISNVLAQKTAEEYLAAVPVLSFNPCAADYSQKQEFREEIQMLNDSLSAELEARRQESEQFQEEHQAEEQVNVLMKLGYTREQAEKLKNADNMSEEERLAIANEMMMNKNYMTIEDYKKVADYDTAAQRRWAQSQSTIMMADMDSKKVEEEQEKFKHDFDLQNEFMFQNNKVRAGQDKYLQQIHTLDKEADSARRLLDQQLDKERKNLENCTNDQQRDQVEGRMKNLMDTYCRQFTPRYLEIIDRFKVYISHNLSEYDKLEKLQIRSIESQTGVKNPDYKIGSMSLGLVGTYISLLSDSFKYSLYNNLGLPIFD